MNEPESRFWGVVLQPGNRYEQTLQNDFHISMATLDLAKADVDACRVQVKVEVDGQSFIICHLLADQCVQQPLDLMFDAGDTIAFSVEGSAVQPVHLTGYYTEPQHDDEDFELEEEESDVEEEESDEIEEDLEPPQLMAIEGVKKKKKGKTAVAAMTNGSVKQAAVKSGKRKQTVEESKPTKLSKLSDSVDIEEESDDEDYEGVEEEDNDDNEEAEDEEIEEGFSDGSFENGIEADSDEAENGEDAEENKVDEKELSPSFPQKNKSKKANKGKVEESPKVDTKSKSSNKASKNENKKKVSVQESTPQSAKKTNGVAKNAKRTLNGGILIEDLTVGSGPEAKQGKNVTVYYRGVLKQNNKQFDATTSGPGFKFRLGAGEVIKGWDRGVEGMRVGGKRRITCPPLMAYGKRGCHPVIPGNSTLVFEVTLKNVN